MTDNKPSPLLVWLPYASLLITIAAFSAGAPIKLARHHAALPILSESDFRDEPVLFTMQPETRSWRGFNSLTFGSMIARK